MSNLNSDPAEQAALELIALREATDNWVLRLRQWLHEAAGFASAAQTDAWLRAIRSAHCALGDAEAAIGANSTAGAELRRLEAEASDGRG